MCSFFKFHADNGNTFTGRTFEAPGEYDGMIVVVPRGTEIAGQLTRYGMVAMENFGTDDAYGLYFDAFNEHGLSVVANGLEDGDYGEPKADSVVVTDVVALIAMSCKNVEEGIEFFHEHSIKASPVAECENKTCSGYHWALTDANRSVVVEVVGGGTVKVYENEVGVMTNEPTFDVHLANISALNPRNFNEENFHAFDLSCEGRFNKLAALNARQLEPVKTDLDAVHRAWAMINTIDIPPGTLYWREVSDVPQVTSWSAVIDIANKVYYFRTYDNMTVQKIDLEKIDFDTVAYKRDRLFGKADYNEYQFA